MNELTRRGFLYDTLEEAQAVVTAYRKGGVEWL